MVAVRVYIVRHGETDENRQGIMQGQLDTKLNEAGKEQARMTAIALDKVPFKVAYSSDLSRAVETANMILEKHPDVPLVRHEALRERYMGSWQGHRVSGRTAFPVDGEHTSVFTNRAIRWWNDKILSYATSLPRQPADEASPETAAHILVTTHGGLIGVLLQGLMGSRKLKCARGVAVGRCLNASITVIDVERNRRATLVKFGDVAHLLVDLVAANVDELEQ